LKTGIASILAAVALTPVAIGQDAFKVAPQAYNLQFENDWVKVARVHYGPRAKVSEHDHPAAATVFVYLNNSGPVRLYHVGEKPFENIRPPTKAGGFRLAQAAAESHSVENLSDLPSDFLRVELKTDPVDAKSFEGRFPPDTNPPDTAEMVAFENGQVRIVRISCGANQTCDISSKGATPALVIAFEAMNLKVSPKNGAIDTLAMETGQTRWLGPGDQATIENRGAKALQQLRIEFRSNPVKIR
jgi:hypothetical protein